MFKKIIKIIKEYFGIKKRSPTVWYQGLESFKIDEDE